MPVKTIKRIPAVTRDHAALVLTCVGLSAFGGVVAVAVNAVSEQADNSVKKSTLEANCEEFGNPLREGLRAYFREQLQNVKNPDPKVLARFGLTKEEALELSAENIEQLEHNINVRFAPVPCSQVYKDD